MCVRGKYIKCMFMRERGTECVRERDGVCVLVCVGVCVCERERERITSSPELYTVFCCKLSVTFADEIVEQLFRSFCLFLLRRWLLLLLSLQMRKNNKI